jgi:putative sterol carrier protein
MDATKRFFDEVSGPQPLLGTRSGTVRFDITNGRAVEHYFVTVDRGTVKVGHKKAAADAVLRVDRGLCEKVVTGRANATAALLRGSFEAEGDLGLLITFQRLFPGPPKKRGRRGA